jgi:carbonic anhydrase
VPEFADVVASNEQYSEHFDHQDLKPVARAGLAIVTCMDSRIAPLEMLGLEPGDAKILRNAGARVTDDVLRTLVLATHLLGVRRVMVVAHTECKMASATQEEIEGLILAESGIDTRSLDFGLVSDQRATLVHDVQRVRSWPFLPGALPVAGFLYHVEDGHLERVC